jgi:hypothetical protein
MQEIALDGLENFKFFAPTIYTVLEKSSSRRLDVHFPSQRRSSIHLGNEEEFTDIVIVCPIMFSGKNLL